VSVLDGVGYVSRVREGAIEVERRLDVDGGTVITASITNEAVSDLELMAGD
jgi:molybdopterin-binding protein